MPQSRQVRLVVGVPDRVSTVHDGLTTSFDLPTGGPWYYFNRLHVGATAWFIFAEQQWNYWGIPADQVIPYQNEH